jgi:hypothetical protein
MSEEIADARLVTVRVLALQEVFHDRRGSKACGRIYFTCRWAARGSMVMS